ncbi:MAG: undecaprenyl-diphosphate phosphatase [Candidatus Paceibacterota bacterium]
MNIFDVFILSMVEGFTEFLPVSSTGHLIIVSKFLGIDTGGFSSSFHIAIQLGAILAIVILYWRSLFLNQAIIYRLLVALTPTLILGFIFYDFIKEVLLQSQMTVVIMFFLGGLVLILFEWWRAGREEVNLTMAQMPFKSAGFIGLCQAVSLIPGVSRSAASILGGLWLGLDRKTVVEFSFLLAVPTMAAATGWDLIQSSADFSADEFGLLMLGFIFSLGFSLLAVKFLLIYIEKYSFIPFGVYRIILAAILFLILFI